jgi:hypothetical protein
VLFRSGDFHGIEADCLADAVDVVEPGLVGLGLLGTEHCYNFLRKAVLLQHNLSPLVGNRN